MVIRRSSAGEVAALLRDVERGDDRLREAALARLAVIGTRAVEGLIALVRSSDAPLAARTGALAALESVDDPRAVDPAGELLQDRGADRSLVLAAAGVLRRALESSRGTEALDRLAAVALDTQRDDHARLAALHALGGLSARVREPICRKLAQDPSAAVRAAVSATGPTPEIDPAGGIEAAAGGQLPEEPDSIRRWLAASGHDVPLPTLHRLVGTIRAREASESERPAKVGWMTARAAVHLALAERRSPVALYDLRETIESGAEAPVEMLTALEAIGDRSCLEPIAAAYARLAVPPPSHGGGPAAGDASAWWRTHLRAAFKAIVGRERITDRHALSRRIRARWPGAANDLLGPPRAGH